MDVFEVELGSTRSRCIWTEKPATATRQVEYSNTQQEEIREHQQWCRGRKWFNFSVSVCRCV